MSPGVQFGFSINEILALATLATGTCWVAWKLRKRRAIKRCCRNRREGKFDGVVCGHCVRGRDHG